MAASSVFWAFTLALVSVLSVCDAGEMCRYSYCEHGCCDYDDDECCSDAVGIIVGLCVAAGVTIIVVIIIICVCRRRQYRGHVYQSHPGATVIVQQGVTATPHGVVNTAGLQPGVAYPPYQPYMPQPLAAPSVQVYHNQPYPPPMYTQAPPSYDSVAAASPPDSSNAPAYATGFENSGYRPAEGKN